MHIFKADTPSPEIVAQVGDYEAMYSGLLQRSGYTGAIKSWDVKDAQEYPEGGELGSMDIILISGSVHDAWSDEPWVLKLLEWTRMALSIHLRIVGVCFGHQIVARALGAPVGRSSAWELGSMSLRLTERGEKVLGAKHINILQSHLDEVRALPHGAVLLASTEQCAIQSYYQPGAYLCVQGHPEFTQGVVLSIIDRVHDSLSEHERAKAHASATIPHNGDIFGAAIVRFINAVAT